MSNNESGYYAGKRCVATILVAFTAGLPACDQFSTNRYEITKDQSGRTLRLDKRTGEIAVVEGERVAPIRDAKSFDTDRAIKENDLARLRTYPAVPLANFGLQASLRTSWQDGKLLYAVTFNGVAKKPGSGGADEPKQVAKALPIDWKKFDRHTWFLILEDAPFQLAKETLSFTEIVDDNGKTLSHQAKGSIVMPSETYQRIDVWTVVWRQRY